MIIFLSLADKSKTFHFPRRYLITEIFVNRNCAHRNSIKEMKSEKNTAISFLGKRFGKTWSEWPN